MTKRKALWIIFLVAMILLGVYTVARADGLDLLPDGVSVFPAYDHICVVAMNENDVELECFCPCEDTGWFELCTEERTEERTDNGTPTQPPDTPDPTPKPKCNCGHGNLSEGCDPNPMCNQQRNSGNEEGDGKKPKPTKKP